MKRKGTRPSRHYRNVKTKKGRKKVLVNPAIKKKQVVRRRRNKPTKSAIHSKADKKSVSLSQLSPSEIERRIDQQTEMNLMKDLQEIGDYKNKIRQAMEKQAKVTAKMREAQANEQRQQMAEARERLVEEAKEGRDQFFSTKRAKKKLGEFDNLMSQLERKRKDNTKVDFAEQIFGGSGKNMNEKLEDLERLAKTSKDPDLLAKADDARAKFEEFIYGPQKREIMRDLEEREKSGKLSAQEKLGLDMIRMPEVTKSTTKIISTLPENLPPEFADWNEFKKKNKDVLLRPPSPKEWELSLRQRQDMQKAYMESLARQEQKIKEAEKAARELAPQARENMLQALERQKRDIAQEMGVGRKRLSKLSEEKEELRAEYESLLGDNL